MAGRPPQPVELASSGRAHSMPTRVKPASHTHLARFASKPVPRAYVPKRARSRAAGRAEPVTSQDSLAAEVLLSLCPSGYREIGCDVGDGAVESAAPARIEGIIEQKQTEEQAVAPAAHEEQVLQGSDICGVCSVGIIACCCSLYAIWFQPCQTMNPLSSATAAVLM